MHFFQSHKGFAYLYLLLAVMIMGILSAIAGSTWKQIMQREAEEELLFRGMQIQEAIRRWHQPQKGSQHVATPLNDLKDLLNDPRTPSTVRYLRRLYTDPITNDDWILIREPERGIIGVASSSKKTVIKKANFPDQLLTFSNRERYEEWQFTYQPTSQQQSAGTASPAAPAASPL